MRSDCQRYHSMVDNESVAALFLERSRNTIIVEKTALPKTLDLIADVPSWSVSDYRACSGQLLDVRRLAGIFPEGQSKLIVDRRGMRYDTDIGAWKRRWFLMRQ